MQVKINTLWDTDHWLEIKGFYTGEDGVYALSDNVSISLSYAWYMADTYAFQITSEEPLERDEFIMIDAFSPFDNDYVITPDAFTEDDFKTMESFENRISQIIKTHLGDNHGN